MTTPRIGRFLCFADGDLRGSFETLDRVRLGAIFERWDRVIDCEERRELDPEEFEPEFTQYDLTCLVGVLRVLCNPDEVFAARAVSEAMRLLCGKTFVFYRTLEMERAYQNVRRQLYGAMFNEAEQQMEEHSRWQWKRFGMRELGWWPEAKVFDVQDWGSDE